MLTREELGISNFAYRTLVVEMGLRDSELVLALAERESALESVRQKSGNARMHNDFILRPDQALLLLREFYDNDFVIEGLLSRMDEAQIRNCIADGVSPLALIEMRRWDLDLSMEDLKRCVDAGLFVAKNSTHSRGSSWNDVFVDESPAAYISYGMTSVDEWIEAAKIAKPSVIEAYNQGGASDIGSVKELVERGISPKTFSLFAAAGVNNVDDISWCVENELTAESYAKMTVLGLSREEMIEANQLGSPLISSAEYYLLFLRNGVSDVAEMARYVDAGVSPAKLRLWRMFGICDLESIKEHIASGITDFVLLQAGRHKIMDIEIVRAIHKSRLNFSLAREYRNIIGYAAPLDECRLKEIYSSVPSTSARIRSGGRLLEVEVYGWRLVCGDDKVSDLIEAERVMAAFGGRSRLVEVYDAWMKSIINPAMPIAKIPNPLRPSLDKARIAYAAAVWVGDI